GVGNRRLGRTGGIGNYPLVTVAYLRGHGNAGKQTAADRHVCGETEIAPVESPAGRFGGEMWLGAPGVRGGAGRAADGIRAEESALRPPQDLDAVHVEQVLVGSDGARQIDAIEVHADAGIQVEGEVILTDAADGG